MTTTAKRTILIAASLALVPFAAGADTVRKAPVYGGHGPDHRADAVVRVEWVADELAGAAARAFRTAEDTVGHVRHGNGYAIFHRLHDLEACAASFADAVRRSPYAPYRLRDAYRQLISTYRQAAYALERAYTGRRLERAFDRVSDLVYDLRYAWDDAYGNGWDRPRHGRGGYDRPRDDRGDRRPRVDIRLRLPGWSWYRR